MQAWTRKPGFPGGRDGPWIHSAVEVFRMRNDDDDGGDDPAEANVHKQARTLYITAQARKMAAEAEKIELQNRKTKGELIGIDEVRAEMEDVFAYLRDALRRLPDDAGNEVPAENKPAVIAMLRRKVNSYLQEFADKAGRAVGG